MTYHVMYYDSFSMEWEPSGQEIDNLEEAIAERGSREATILEKNVGILSTIANLTPLLGLLGTVSGMIKTFNAISLHGVGNAGPLAGGIAEALITTATGL